MASKYLREISMRAFNDFWCGRVGKPGADQPAAQVTPASWPPSEVQAELGMARAVLWREQLAKDRHSIYNIPLQFLHLIFSPRVPE